MVREAARGESRRGGGVWVRDRERGERERLKEWEERLRVGKGRRSGRPL